MKIDKDTWVVIPAYNEGERIGVTIDQVKKFCKQIIVVDDGSTDHTYDIALSRKVFVVRHRVNLGKGAGLKTGCDFALYKKAKRIIAIDADGQHNPEEIPRFLELLKSKDIIFGYRKLNRDMPFILRFGNGFISSLIQILYGVKVKDSQCGYRAFTAETYRKIRWRAKDYSVESEMIALVGKKKLRYGELPIQTIYADKYKGTTVVDGIKIVFQILSWRLFT